MAVILLIAVIITFGAGLIKGILKGFFALVWWCIKMAFWWGLAYVIVGIICIFTGAGGFAALNTFLVQLIF